MTTRPGCSADTDYRWKCVPKDSEVCGTSAKPTDCGDEPVCTTCTAAESGWEWRCPSNFDKQYYICDKGLQCEDIVISDDLQPTDTKQCTTDKDCGYSDQKCRDKTCKRVVNICFNDALPMNSGTGPGLFGVKCATTDSMVNHTYGSAADQAIGNPPGHLVQTSGDLKNPQFSDLVFYPYDENKRRYFKPNETPRVCLLSTDVHGPTGKIGIQPLQNPAGEAINFMCQNNGTFIQTKPYGTEGTCACTGAVGPLCQYTAAHSCGPHGAASISWQDNDFVCSGCKDSVGPKCQYTDLTTCHGHGTASADGTCACQSPWKGAGCQYSDATTCSGHGTVDDNGHCTCVSGYQGGACQCGGGKMPCHSQDGTNCCNPNATCYATGDCYDTPQPCHVCGSSCYDHCEF